MGDIADIVTAGTALATVMDSNVARAMPAHAHAGICSDNLFDIMLVWNYGASLNGLGLFIADAHVYVEIGSVGLGGSYTVTAKFNDIAQWDGDQGSPVAVLGGEADIYHEHFGMTEDSDHIHFEIRGDGAGRIWT